MQLFAPTFCVYMHSGRLQTYRLILKAIFNNQIFTKTGFRNRFYAKEPFYNQFFAKSTFYNYFYTVVIEFYKLIRFINAYNSIERQINYPTKLLHYWRVSRPISVGYGKIASIYVRNELWRILRRFLTMYIRHRFRVTPLLAMMR